MKCLMFLLMLTLSLSINASQSDCVYNLDNYILLVKNKMHTNDNDKLLLFAVYKGQIVETRFMNNKSSTEFTLGFKTSDVKWSMGKPEKIKELNIFQDMPEYQIYKNGLITLKGHYDLPEKEQVVISTHFNNFKYNGVGFNICVKE